MRLLLANLGVLAALALALAGGAELWLRMTIPPSSGESIYRYTLDTPRYKVMKPNASIVAWGKELRTNDLGFRDEAAAVPPKRPGEFRIIVLGASFTVSAGVDYGRIYTSLLRERLRQAYPQASVINLAVGGYNVLQYAMVLEEVGLRLQPDLVLVGICPNNDFGMKTYETNRRVARGELPAEPEQRWYEKLYVYRAYGARAAAGLGRLLAEGSGPASAPGAWERNADALRSIHRAARERGVPVAVALLPETWDMDKQRAGFARVQKLCGELGVPCVNLLEAFAARGVEEASLRLNAIDAHPNEKYNALVAEALAPQIARLLPAAAGREGAAQ
jgi:lysophospholipase L1-like esterase